MKIVQLHAENFKRLGVVEITPEGNVVTVGGKNGQGKSSVLDAIFVALKGRAVAPPKPIRKGEERALIRLDMGDLVVTRTFIAQEDGTFTTGIKVESADGLRYQKPQDVLDALLGEIGFDPFEFVNLKPKEQAARLLEMVPLSIDLDEYREQDASDFAKRTEVNRDVARLRAQVEAIEVEEVPDEAPDRTALADQLGNAANVNAGIERERVEREQAQAGIDRMYETADTHEATAADLRRQADEAEQRAKDLRTAAGTQQDELNARPPLGQPVDTDAIRQQLREAEGVLAAIDRQARRKALATELQDAESQSQALTDALAQRAAERNKALAEAELPVEGLAFAINERGEPVLNYDGLPFEKDQISTAVQLRVSTAIGMAANPRLRVLRISDGSLLDEDSMKMLGEMAEAEDFQLWVEVVGDREGVGIVMENGLVRGSGPEGDVTAGPGVEGEADSAPPPPKAKKAADKGEKLL